MSWNSYQSKDLEKSRCSLPHTMPNPASWNIRDLDWNFNRSHFDPRQQQPGPSTSLTTFTANTTPVPSTSCKRKSLDPAPRPSKQFISEKKMIEHLNGLHLSSDFTNHNISPEASEGYKVFMSPADLEEKLRNAQRITILEEVRSLADDTLIPKTLMDRVGPARPYCSALVLWQPPSEILKLEKGTEKKESSESESEDDSRGRHRVVDEMEADAPDNNNSSDIDFNQLDSNTMDLDL